jgi:hypothetical protein
MNVERLEAVRDHILAHPEQFQMSRWHAGRNHCIAGFAPVLFGKWYERALGGRLLFNKEGSTLVRAMEIFDITLPQAYELFYVAQWSNQHRAQQYSYEFFKNKRRAARIAANEINSFIARHNTTLHRVKAEVKKQLVRNLDAMRVNEKTQETRDLVFHS